MKKAFLWAEVSSQIGMGHFMECLAIADELRLEGWEPIFMIDPFVAAEEMLVSKRISFEQIRADDFAGIEKLVGGAEEQTPLFINHRSIQAELLAMIKPYQLRTIVIDQWGDKELDCDLVVNSTLVEKWRRYKLSNPDCQLCLGPQYAIVRKEFNDLHEQGRTFERAEKKVLVTLGGVDRTGTTLHVMNALRDLDRNIKKEIILGKGFSDMERFQKIFSEVEKDNFSYAQNVPDLAQRLFGADLAISSGGNTLYEMACVGTPGLVLWEDWHENDNGAACEQKGTVRNVGQGIKTDARAIFSSVEDLLNDPKELAAMSRRGKELVDGRGISRMLERVFERVS